MISIIHSVKLVHMVSINGSIDFQWKISDTQFPPRVMKSWLFHLLVSRRKYIVTESVIYFIHCCWYLFPWLMFCQFTNYGLDYRCQISCCVELISFYDSATIAILPQLVTVQSFHITLSTVHLRGSASGLVYNNLWFLWAHLICTEHTILQILDTFRLA